MKILTTEQGITFSEMTHAEFETLKNALRLFLRETSNEEALQMVKTLESEEKKGINPNQLSLFSNPGNAQARKDISFSTGKK